MGQDHVDVGTVKAGSSGQSFRVTWYPISGEVYVNYASSTYVGKASSSRDACWKAEAWLRNK